MRVIKLKSIPRFCFLILLITLTFETSNILVTSDASLVLAQNRGRWDLGDRYYERGFQAGRQDARRGLSNNYWRYRRDFNDQWELQFRQGYQDGYQGQYGPGYDNRDRNRYYGYRNRGYGQRSYGYVNGPYNDSLTGSMVWRGRVDHYVELQIRGNRVDARERQGAPTINAGANFTSPLPRAEVEVFVRKNAGRGEVSLVQSPSRFNGYTAVVAIDDEKGGADNYEIELSWR